MTTPMQWVSVLSTQASLEAAVRDVAEQAKRRLSAMPDLGLVFISSAFTSEFPRLLPLLHDAIELPVLIGCSGGGVIGVNDRGQVVEVEQKPALSLCLATLPGVTVTPFHLSQDTLPDLDSPPDTWVEQIGADPVDAPHFILMADPFSSGVNDVLQGLDFAYPGAVKVGGLAGVNDFQGGSTLFLNQTLHSGGLVGVALAGNIAIDAIVAQGCRPIGKPYRVVEAERNIVLKLESPDSFGDGDLQTPLEALQGILKGLDEGDRKLAQHSLFIGVVQDGFKIELHPGDFLIRNLLGVDPRSGAIAVGDRIRPGQRVQFHLRDARTSAEDLETLLLRYQAERSLNASAPAAGALMFACVGRGEGLYRKPNFDSQLFGRVLDTVPLAGFFCGGEIGPIGGTTFLHGYTSVFGICRPAQIPS